MRREPEHFEHVEPVLVYAARRQRHARRVETLLSDAGLDYVVETDTIASGFLFRTERMGAFFYVVPGDEERAREVLATEGFVLRVSKS